MPSPSAAAVLTTLTEYLIASLSPAYAGATLLAQTLQLSFDGAATISVPIAGSSAPLLRVMTIGARFSRA